MMSKEHRTYFESAQYNWSRELASKQHIFVIPLTLQEIRLASSYFWECFLVAC